MSRAAFKKVFPIYQLIDLIFEMDNLSSSEKLLCIALLRFHNRKSGRCFPGLTRLSESTGMSRKTLIENTKKLVKKKVIKVKTGDRRKPNEYTLLFIGWLEIEPLIEPQPIPLIEPPVLPLTPPKPRKGKGKVKENKEKDIPQNEAFEEPEEEFYLTKRKRKLSGKRLETFELFWSAFNYKFGKAAAADRWLEIPVLKNGLVNDIIKAAETENSLRQEKIDQGLTPKYAQGWIYDRRWEDEHQKQESMEEFAKRKGYTDGNQ